MQYGHSDFISSTIGEMIANNINLDAKKPTIILPMGMGILDLAVADFIYNHARERGLTIEIENFFGPGREF